MLIVKPKNTKNSLWMIGFHPMATSEATFRKNFSLSVSLFQVSMHLHQTNAKNTHMAEYLWLYSLIQSTCPGLLIRENYIGVGTNIWSFIQDPWPYLSLFWPSFWVYVIFTWVIKIISDCWCFLISRMITFRNNFAVFCHSYYTLYHMLILR